jgi:hypothetical protein
MFRTLDERRQDPDISDIDEMPLAPIATKEAHIGQVNLIAAQVAGGILQTLRDSKGPDEI